MVSYKNLLKLHGGLLHEFHMLTLKVEATTNNPADYSMDWLTGVSGLPHVVIESLRQIDTIKILNFLLNVNLFYYPI